MARSTYYVEPWKKHIEIFQNFSGGLNTMTSNDNLSVTELPNLNNVDLGERGSLKRRHGMKPYQQFAVTGTPQGFFRFYRSETDYDDLVIVAGQFFVNGVETVVGDGSLVVQTTRPMEAVQFGAEMFIASGSGLLVFDGNTIEEVVPYAPKPLEALYVGLNGLANDPDNFMQDGVSAVLSLQGVTFDSRYGVANEFITATAYISSPAGMSVEYRFERKLSTDKDWFLQQDWSTDKSCTFSTEWTGDLQLRVRVREKGTSVYADQYIVPKYTIKPTADPKDEEVPSTNIDSCNRILLNWGRLIMYGDTEQEDAIFVSHLKNPRYFPLSNSLRFKNPKKEQLNALVPYRDNLVAFTPSTIQALFGKSPLSFQRIMLHSDIGAIAPYSPKVVDNYIIFLSSEGVYVLKAVGTSETRANVEKVDTRVEDQIPIVENACGEVHDNQYHIVFPDANRRMRYYYNFGVWTKDESPKMDFHFLKYQGGILYGQTSLGPLMQFDENTWDDDGYVYEDMVETKSFDFDLAYNEKKLKEQELSIADNGFPVTMTIQIFIGDAEAVNEVVTIDPTVADRKVLNELATLIYRLRTFGKGLQIKTVTKHSASEPNQVLGVGYIFKLKKP